MPKTFFALTVALCCASGAQALTLVESPGQASGALLGVGVAAPIVGLANNGGFTVGETGLGNLPGKASYKTVNYNIVAGEALRFSFEMAGNPNGDGSEIFSAGLTFTAPTLLSKFDPGGAIGNVAIDTNLTITSRFITGNIVDTAGFSLYIIDITAGSTGTVSGLIETGTLAGIGPMVRRWKLSGYREEANVPEQPAPPPLGPIPEPATWGLLLAGFGLVGATLRRRRSAVAA